jgi:hypothetical protein
VTSSAASGGRPRGLDFRAQKRANPRRCQATTVAGLTITSVSAHRDQARDRAAQKARSRGHSRGRGVARYRTASCCRSARFSSTKVVLGRNAEKSAPTIAFTSASMCGACRVVPRLSAENRRRLGVASTCVLCPGFPVKRLSRHHRSISATTVESSGGRPIGRDFQARRMTASSHAGRVFRHHNMAASAPPAKPLPRSNIRSAISTNPLPTTKTRCRGDR